MNKHVTIVGLGMGNPDMLSQEARQALASCDVIIGASRALESLQGFLPRKVTAIKPEDIRAALTETAQGSACVVFTGDVGLYSGAHRLYPLLADCTVHVVAGISSLQYVAAKLRRPWQNVHIVSGHGVACHVFSQVFNHAETFFLTDAKTTPQSICRELTAQGLGGLTVHIGDRLSYPDERIVSSLAEELCDSDFTALSVVWVDNPLPFVCHPTSQGLPDDAFLRGKAPMTKRMVRAAALSLLQIAEEDTLYDIGAGTGSISVEMARLARRGKVFAIESDAEACGLVAANKERFGVRNLHLVQGEAPAALAGLPCPDAAFVGGSDGQMEGIIDALLTQNPVMRLVVSAVTLETIAETQRLFMERKLANIEVTQLAVAQSKPMGKYTMMMAQNPVTLFYGEGSNA